MASRAANSVSCNCAAFLVEIKMCREKAVPRCQDGDSAVPRKRLGNATDAKQNGTKLRT